MSTVGSFSSKSPTVRRILREATELSTSPSPDFAASPLETNLFEWHFTLRGPPDPSPFASGLYHGRIVLPPSYPLRPPSFRFLTPSGRFEVNREICLSISGFHEETWQPAWGIRTALTAIRAFMDGSSAGQIGGLDAAEGVRRRMARESLAWKCAGCGGRANEEVMREQEKLCEEMEGDKKDEAEKIPEELRLGYKDEMDGTQDGGPGGSKAALPTKEAIAPTAVQEEDATVAAAPAQGSDPRTTSTDDQEDGLRYRAPRNLPISMPIRAPQAQTRSAQAPTTIPAAAGPAGQRQAVLQQQSQTPWLDKAIQIVAVALGLAILRYLFR